MKLKVEHNNLKKYIEILLGIIAFGIEFNLFISPLNIVVGGSSGLAILFNKLFNIDKSTFITIFYILMVLLNLLVYGFKNTRKLLLGSILYPISINLFAFLPKIIVLDYSNKLLYCIFAAIFSGIGGGLTYKNDFLTGGTDVPKKIMSDKLKIPMSTAIRMFDGTLILLGGFIFGLNNIFYAIIILYISSKVVDKIMLGISNKKMFYIMTNKPDEIREEVTNTLRCGITEIEALGGLKEKKHNILMCVISTRDYIKLKDIINKIDSKAFFIVTDSYYMYHKKEVR